MRLSEKSIELNFCSEATASVGLSQHPFWCGLTQRQEASLGFDVAGHRGGKLFIYQFKASNKFVGGFRRFEAPHDQFSKLAKLATGPDQVFYVFPDVGTTNEFVSLGALTPNAWLCDVHQNSLKTLGAPGRNSGKHYVDLDPSKAKCYWHSEPVAADLIRADGWFSKLGERQREVRPGLSDKTQGPGIPMSADRIHGVFEALSVIRSRKLLGLYIK